MSLFRSAHFIRFLLPASVLALTAAAQSTAPAPAYRWTTLAGRASIGLENGPVAAARFNNPHGLALDVAGNLYVADTGNHTIRKISPTGIVTTFAGLAEEPGSANGAGGAARFNAPQGVAADLNGNVYVADTGNHTIRKITPAGSVTTLAGQPGIKGLADGAAVSALFDSPDRLTVDTAGNVYLFNNGVRKISGGQVRTVSIPARAPDPDGNSVTIKSDRCPAVDAAGQLYFTTSVPGEIARVDSAGFATVFRDSLYGVYNSGSYYAYRYDGDTLFNGASGNLFLEIVLTAGFINREIKGVPMQPDGTLDLVHTENFTNVLGRPAAPIGLAVDQSGRWYYTRSNDYYPPVGDNAIFSQGVVFAGTPLPASALDASGGSARLVAARYLASDTSGNLWVAAAPAKYAYETTTEGYLVSNSLHKISPNGMVASIIQPQFSYLNGIQTYPKGLTADGSGKVYLAKEGTNRSSFSSEIIRIASDGALSSLGVTNYDPYYRGELTADSSGTLTQVFDAIQYQGVQQELTIKQRQSDGTWVTIAGGSSREILDGTGGAARFKSPYSLTVDRAGNIFLLDSASTTTDPAVYIRKITPTGVVTTISKKLTSSPSGLTVDSKGTFFLTHGITGIVTQIDPNGDEITIGGIAGKSGSKDGTGDQARFGSPGRIVADAQDNLYLIDGSGTTVRKGEYLGNTPLITGQPQSQTVAAGGNVQFSVTANSATAVTYQWYLNGSTFNDATSSTLSFANARSADAGDYTVVVTNAAGSVTSNKATLSVGTPALVDATPAPTATGAGGGGSIEAWFALALLTIGAARRRAINLPAIFPK